MFDYYIKHLKYYLKTDVDIFLTGPDSELGESDQEAEPQGHASREGIYPCPTLLPANLSPAVAADIQRADCRDDRALRDIASPDLLQFDWRKEPEIFQGVREAFTGTPGPTFPVNDLESPLQAFLKIWDSPLINLIVRKTNQYAQKIIDQKKTRLKKIPVSRLGLQQTRTKL